MAETTKLSAEKALKKLRQADAKSKAERHDEQIDALDEEIKRMRSAEAASRSSSTAFEQARLR